MMSHNTDNSAERATDLPPLPEPAITAYQTDSVMRTREVRSFAGSQMQAYGRACIAAYRERAQVAAPVAPEGWKLAPIEPTKAMMLAGDKIMDCDPKWVGRGYRAMLEAAPLYAVAPPVQELSDAGPILGDEWIDEQWDKSCNQELFPALTHYTAAVERAVLAASSPLPVAKD